MKSLNVLIALDTKESRTLDFVKQSKYLGRLYATIELKGAVEVSFNTFQELAQKCKALRVDIVIAENEKWILQGIADVLRKNFVNCIALSSRANELILSDNYELLNKYDILTPKKLLYPSKFPVAVRTKGICRAGNSLEEIIEIRKEIAKQSEELAQNIYLEEFIDGEHVNLISLFDGKNLLSFTDNELEREYSAKLHNLLVKEKFEFIGFLNSKLILADNKVYCIGFSSDFSGLRTDIDFIYLLDCAIYQKLNEICI